MSELPRVGDLEIGVDPEFQKREWRVERIGWAMMLLIILAGLLGLLGGPGPLSSTSASGGDGLEVSYERFMHLLEPISLELRVVPEQGQETLGVWLSQSYLENTQIEGIVPEPESVVTGDERLIFNFPLAEPAQEIRVVFKLRSERPGTRQGELGIDGGSSVALSQFVYP